MKIAVIDGQGGRLGRTLVEKIQTECPTAELMVVGLNSAATQSMLKTGGAKGATGENAAIVACRKADLIVGPIGIAIADSLMGEVSPAVANAVGGSCARRVLIPMNLCDTYIAGVNVSSAMLIQDAMNQIKKWMEETR